MHPDPVDLRSDTVTRPTPAMRDAMLRAEVGDDVFGDDPTVQALEARIAALTGKEAALYVPSGTMGNQLAVMSHIGPGDEVLVDRESHVFCHEQGGIATNAGGLTRLYDSDGGVPRADLLERAVYRKFHDDHAARFRLVCFENTVNSHGGVVVPLERLERLGADARRAGVRTHLDGARLWNASVASGIPVRAWAAAVDTVMMCFSKGLGAPVGSVLAGDAATIRLARRHRKRLGGGMRQAGLLCAACLHALDHHMERLADDHRRARRLADGLRAVPGVAVNAPDTNIVMVRLEHPSLDPDRLLAALETAGVRMIEFAPRRLRAITHLDVSDEGIERAIAAFGAAAGALAAGAGGPAR